MGSYPGYFKSFRTERIRQFLKSIPHYFNELRDTHSVKDLIAFLQFKMPYIFNVPSFPPRVTSELTNNCNFSCRHCFRSLIKRDIVSLDYELAEKIVEEISQYSSCIIKIGGMGEPSLYKECDRFMKLLRDREIRQIFYTNLSL